MKALERRYRARADTDCYYLSLSDELLLPRLAREVGLPLDTDLNGFIAHVTASSRQGLAGTSARDGDKRQAGDGNRKLLFLIDEADAFVAAEAEHDYRTLRRLRSL